MHCLGSSWLTPKHNRSNGGGLGHDDDTGIISQINVVPLVDITLVVLIIFMLTADIIANRAIELELPEASTGTGVEPTTVALTLSREGALFLNGQPTNEVALRSYLPELAKTDPKIQAIIAADEAIDHGRVVWLIDLIRQLGIHKFALNIDPVPLPPDRD